jgi:hypothetical protein
MTRFEESLLTELTTLVETEKTSPRRAFRRPKLIAAAVGSAAVLAAGLLGPGGRTPAYALERQGNGAFRLAVHQVSGIDEANEALAAEGIRARVYALGPIGSCPEHPFGDRPDDPPHLKNIGDIEEGWFYIPRDIPQDVTLVINVHPEDPVDSLTLTWSAVRGDAPPCTEAGPDPYP